MDNEILHYGTPRHSGRYPWGSGEDPEQRGKSFLGRVDELKSKGLSEKEIADGLGMSIAQLRSKKTIAKAEQRKADYAQALKWKEKGMSNVEIGKRLGGWNESSVRSLLNATIQERSEETNTVAKMLKESVDKKGYVDVGAGVERHIGIKRTKLKASIEQLKEEGYLVTYIPVEQLGTGKKTSVMVLSKPESKKAIEIVKLKNQGLDDSEISKRLGMDEESVKSTLKETFSNVYKNKDNIRMITDYSEDGGKTVLGLEPPKNIDSKRIHIRYHEDGGSDKDGVIELRRGVDELSLGNAKYAQVRIAVDGTHYLKGMAMYSDDMPKGADIIYNTNKTKDKPKEKVFKEMKSTPEYTYAAELRDKGKTNAEIAKMMGTTESSVTSLLNTPLKDRIDLDNPFGATVRQRHYTDSKGKEHLSALNVVSSGDKLNEEGRWGEWSKSLSSQVLSKQTPALAKKQLSLAFDIKKEEYDEIMSLTNPAVRKKLLESFADDCDSSAVHLKAAGLPRQGSHVILPFPDMKQTEVYAPNYQNGDRVVLIRYPHGGIFEIPELTVNNRHATAKSLLGAAKDAIGIHPKVAEQLSGADFDGDTVLVIPNNNKSIKTSSPLKGLKDFNPKEMYPAYEGMPKISPRTKQMKMGDVSNLITDMTIKGATNDEIAAAVRHSMVVIDSEKHNLNYKQSYIDNGIAALKKRYQGSERSGASTLISRASSEKRVDHRVEGKLVLNPETGKTKRMYIDPATGNKLYQYTGETYTDRNGKVHPKTVKSTKMAETQDAFQLSSGTPMEAVYAQHANKLKALGNQARKDYINTPPITMSSSAKESYAKEVSSLNAKLNVALKNAPLERQAQVIANSIVATKKEANPNMEADEVKKIKGQALMEARNRVGAGKERIPITDREWEAIQAGAISNNVLTQIINNTDLDKLKALATPRTAKTLSTTKQQRAKQMLAAGRTQAEVASALGVSTSVITKLVD
jgi:DNA-binding CsgD family transcriptional regulator